MRTLIFTLLFLVMGGATPKPRNPTSLTPTATASSMQKDMLSFLTVFNTQWGPDLRVPATTKAQNLKP